MKIRPNYKYKAVIHWFENSTHACLHYYDSNDKWITSSPSFLREDINEIFEQFKKTGKLVEYECAQDRIPQSEIIKEITFIPGL